MGEEEDAVLKELDVFMDNLVDEIFADSQENLVKLDKVDTGFLLKSGNINRSFLEKEIVYTAPHASVVEFGSTPHMPPVDPLIKWARRKLGLNQKEANSAGWAIAMAIKERGIEQAPFLRPAMESNL